MLKILLNHDFLEALIFEEHVNHEKADIIANTLRKDDYLYIPVHVLIMTLDKLEKYDHESNIKFFQNINKTTRIDYGVSKQIYRSAYELFQSNHSLNFLDCLTIKYMENKDFKYLISFNEKFDEVKGIKRLYKVDEYYPHRLNFI